MQAHSGLCSILQACNENIRMEESYQELVRLEQQLVWDRIDNPYPVADRNRKLLKIGALKLLKMDGQKVVKSKDVVLILLTDMVIYCKPVRSRKPPLVRYEVYEVFPRSYFPVRAREDLNDKKEGQNLMEAELYLEGDDQPQVFIFRAETAALRDAWVQAFEDRGTAGEADYDMWECPEVEAIADYDATTNEELTVRVGERLKVLIRNRDGWTKGYKANYAHNEVLNPAGWFPHSYALPVEELYGPDGQGYQPQDVDA